MPSRLGRNCASGSAATAGGPVLELANGKVSPGPNADVAPVSERLVVPFRYLRQLPRGGNREIGAGYAMATAAAGAAVLYFVVQAVAVLLLSLSVGGGSAGSFALVAVFAFVSGAGSVAAVVAPMGFVAGVVAWRLVPASTRFAGAVGGLLATVLVYLVPGVLAVGGTVAVAVLTGEAVFETVFGVASVLGVAFAVTCLLTLPVGALTGALYERSRPEAGAGTDRAGRDTTSE